MGSATLADSRLRATSPFVGAGGGVGTTTLCRWLGDFAEDRGVTVPEWTGRPIVVVARGTVPSLAAATRIVTLLTSTALAVRAVVAVVADLPAPEPGLVRSRIRALTVSVSGVVRFPYIEAWRYVDDPLSRPLPRAYDRSLHALAALVQHT